MALACLKYDKTVCILGKAYKPKVPYTDGSSSLLVGHYIKKNGGTVLYYDPNTGDTTLPMTDVYLIAHWDTWLIDVLQKISGCVIDPWRQLTSADYQGKIVHYGNSRNKNV
jgi:hypothetical protein